MSESTDESCKTQETTYFDIIGYCVLIFVGITVGLCLLGVAAVIFMEIFSTWCM